SAFILSVVMQPSQTPLRYQWFKNGTTITGATSATYSVQQAEPRDAGTYSCVIANDCGIEESQNAGVIVNEPVSVNEAGTEQSTMAVMPQPATDHITVRFGTVNAGTVDFLLTDIHGRTVVSTRIETISGGEHTADLDVSTLASGTYILTMRSSQGMSSARVAVQR
ncbi:MAG: T9SS C-terminal target domain-containing protein, partial [Ignavibacteriae bacterium]